MFQIGNSFYNGNFDYASYSTFIFLSACTLSWYFKSCLVNIEYTYRMTGRRLPRPAEFVYRRAAHIVVSFKEKLYLWGGYMELPHADTQDLILSRESQNHNPKEIYVYDIIYDSWNKFDSRGIVPPAVTGCCAAVHKEHMYIFGGLIAQDPAEFNPDPIDKLNYGILWRMNLYNFSWKEVKPSGFAPYACDKSSCWVYGNRLYIFGGYGPQPYERNPNRIVNFTPDNSIEYGKKGWLDQFCYLDIENETWVWPPIKGQFPSARAAHAATVIDDKAYLFGGRHKEERLNDLYYVDLLTNEWRNQSQDSNDPRPSGRSWHTFTSITDDKIILHGGFSNTCKVFNDVWLLDVKKLKWKQLTESSYTTLPPRLWHSAAQIGYGEVAFVGGISNNLLSPRMIEKHVEEMLIIRFSPRSLYRTCLDYISRDDRLNSLNELPHEIKNILRIRCDVRQIHGNIN